jgi:hypothetical protein
MPWLAAAAIGRLKPLAHRVMSGAAARLDRLEMRREAHAVYEAETKAEEVMQAVRAMIGRRDADSN